MTFSRQTSKLKETKMDVFFFSFSFLFLTLLANGNGYTFRSGSTIIFAFSNTELSMDELRQRGNRLYLENSEKLSIVCQLVDKSNWSLFRSEELTKKYASTGLQPYITFKNKTWWKTYKFSSKKVVSSVHWRLKIPRDELMQGANDVIFEPWFVKMELGFGLGLFETKGILIKKEPLLNLSQNLGSVVDASLMLKSSEKFVVKPAPCCSDISFVLPFKNKTVFSVGGCYIGVTFGAFTAETILWLDLCQQQHSNRSLCRVFPQMNCNNLRMLDFIVARNYLILATSFGLVRSASFKRLLSGKDLDGEYFLAISSSQTLIGDASSSDTNNIELQYTSYCLDFHVFNERKDFFYLLYNNSIYKSASPFTQLLEMFFSNTLLNGLQVLGVVNDLTKNTHVFLALSSQNKLKTYTVLVMTQEASNYVMFPPWYFPQNSVANHLVCHTWSNTLFVYGSQVWQSRDGGNSFYQLTELIFTHLVTSLSFSQYSDGVVAMTDHGMILSGRVGISRLVAIHHQLFLGSLRVVLMDELENMIGVFQNQTSSLKLFGDYLVDIISRKSYQKHFCSDHLLLQFVGHEDILLFVSTLQTDQPLRRYCLGSYAVGQLFRSRLGGSGHITEITHLNSTFGYSTRVRCKVVDSFIRKSSSSAHILETSIHLSLVYSGSHEVEYIITVPVGTSGWSRNNEGQTVVLSNGMSILLKKYINKTTIYGQPPAGVSPNVLPQGTQNKRTWQLYDLRSLTLVLHRERDLLLVELSSEGFEATATFDFNSTHVGMVIMISGDNHGVIKAVNGVHRVTFINNKSILKEGSYSQWSLYQTPLNETELNSNNFHPDSGYGMWWVEEEICANFPIVTPRQYKTLYHLDSRDNLSLEFSILAKHLEDNDPQITMFVGNPSLFKVKNVLHHFETNHTLKVDLQRKPGTSGLAQMSFNVLYTSLTCPSVSTILTVHGGCPPSKRLVFKYPFTFPPNVFLHCSPTDDKGIIRNFKLPANYRPPSSRGVGIPMSSNLYNVFPEKPPYKERFAISRETRLYKQCREKASRHECGCDENNLSMSSLVAHSDCITTVYRLVFGEIFQPKFIVVEDDALTKSFQDPYYLVELNQRADYDVMSAIELSTSGGMTSGTVLQDSFNSSLEFRGSGLYHFRAYSVQEGYTLCELSDEFIVFVDEMPLPDPARDIVRVTTGMVFVTTTFFAYLWYLYLTKKNDLTRAF